MRCERESVGVVLPACLPSVEGGVHTKLLGLDVHREFTYVVMLERERLTHLGRIPTTPEALRSLAARLGPEDHVVLEATVNTYAIVQLLRQHAGRVVVSNPVQTRAIADAKIKTDKVDAEVLVRLLAGGWLPEVWVPDAKTQALRQQVAHRADLVQQQTRLKNRIQSVLHRNLVPGCPRSDLFGKAGRAWLMQHALPQLPTHEQAMIHATLRELAVVQGERGQAERTLAEIALAQPAVRRLMTIPGIDAVTALAVLAAIGDVHRFHAPGKLVGYLGLDPRVRQSGTRLATTGHISKRGRAHARGLLVEAAWAAVKTPGPLRAFYHRLRSRRGAQIAAVATARKIAVLAWHLLTRDADYTFARPSLMTRKWRALELHAGRPARRGQRGMAHAYNVKAARRQELELCTQAERVYVALTHQWQHKRTQQDAGATNGKRL
jgi:transposase